MEQPFSFDFDSAEEELEKLEEEKSQFASISAWEAYNRLVRILSNVTKDIFMDCNFKMPIEFGHFEMPEEVSNRTQSCYYCKNNIQSKINVCRKCKVRDRKQHQSNFVRSDEPIPPKLKHIWKDVFIES